MKFISKNLLSEIVRIGPVTFWTLVAAAGNFIAGIIIARSLGPEGRGLVSIVVSVAGLVSVAGALGTNVSFRTLWPKRKVNIRGYNSLSLVLAIFSTPLLIVTAIVVGYVIDESVLSWASFALFVLFGVTNLAWLQFKEALNGVGAISYSAAIGAAGSAVFLVLIILVFLLDVTHHDSVLLVYCVMNLFQMIYAMIALRKYSDGAGPLGRRLLLKTGPPYLGYFFGQELALRMNRPLVGAFSSSAAVGHYSVGAGLAEILRLPVLAVSQYVLLDTASGRIGPRAIAKRALVWSLLMGAVVAAIWPFAPFIISFLYGPEYLPGATAFRILLLAQFLLVPFIIFSRGLVGMGGKWFASVPGLVGLAALVATSPALVTHWAATGGAVAAGVAYIAMSITAVALSFYLNRRRGRIGRSETQSS